MALGFIISPAKKMNVVEGPPSVSGLPRHLAQTRVLQQRLEELGYDEAKALWCCSDRFAQHNYELVHSRDLTHNLTAACIAYEGIQYQHLAPQVMDESSLAYLDAHLRILSGFYGVLHPFEGVVPYRLEMQAKLSLPAREGHEATKDLYAFWSDSLACALAEEFDTICNIASVEYAKAVTPYLADHNVRLVTCLFGSVRAQDGRLVQRSTEAKAARGTFVRWCAEHNVTHTSELVYFDERGYVWDEARSTEDTLVFVKV